MSLSPLAVKTSSTPFRLWQAKAAMASIAPTLQATTALQNSGEPYIRLQLDQRAIAAVSTAHAQEVVVVAAQQLTVIPNKPRSIMGLLNHRSRIFWVLDLPQIFGLTPLDPRAPEYHIAILRVGSLHVGVAVKAIQGVTRLSADLIESPVDNALPLGLVPYLRGCIPSQQEMLLILDAEAIATYTG